MITRIFLAIAICLLVVSVDAQKGAGSFIHKVRGGETFRSIANKYGMTGRELADFNNLDYYAGELAAKTLRIPRKPVVKKEDSIKPKEENVAIADTATTTTQAPPTVTEPPVSTTTNPTYTTTEDTTETNKPDVAQSDSSRFSTHIPAIIYIVASLALLTAAIVYYRFVSRT